MSGRPLASAILAVVALTAPAARGQGVGQGAPAASAGADPARTPDAAFVAKAADVIAVDTDLATLAATRSTSEELQALARRVLEARKAIARDLRGMADTRQLTGPASVTATPAAASPVASLREQPASAFDAAFVAALLANGETAVALFEAESRDGRDDEIKEWAARQLPALREHVAALRTLRPRQGS